MRMLRNLVILFILAAGLYAYLSDQGILTESVLEKTSDVFSHEKEEAESAEKLPFAGDLYKWVGKSEQELTEQFGNPVRKDASPYGYIWWVYTNYKDEYIQFGVQDHKVETVYAIGKGLQTDPVKIGDSYEQANKTLAFKDRLTFTEGISSYTFHLKDKDKKMWPLVKVGDHLFAQFYFDTFSNKLSAVRVMTPEVLLKQRPYEIEYRGKLPDAPDLTAKEWKAAESGMEKQILDITNIMRNEHGKKPLKPDERVAEVAFSHSKDMSDHHYFSHYGLDGTGLKERLAEKNLVYLAAGENIAAQYPDAPAAMEGWLNSKGHREALLHDDYTHLGVGVFHFYYTQNFLKKP